jgi:DNA-binding NarL/FixJ family response regulator
MMAARSKKMKVFVVDDHPIVRQGLAQLINHEPDLEVCGEAEDAATALHFIGRQTPDLMLVDISLKDTDGLQLIKSVRSRYKDLPILVVSLHDESLYAERALRAGAGGYIMKQQGTDEMVTAIRKVLQRRVYLSEAMGSRILQDIVGSTTAKPASPLERLSDRELEIFELLGEGLGTRQIADRLHLGIKTVESYSSHIKEKLNLRSGRELLKYAIQHSEREKLQPSEDALAV